MFVQSPEVYCHCFNVTDLCNNISRLYGKLIKNRRENKTEIIEEQQSNFCVDELCGQYFCTEAAIGKAYCKRSRDTFGLCRLTKAYDSVVLNSLWLSLLKNSVSELLVRAVRVLSTNMTSSIKIGSTVSESFSDTKGCTIASALFTIYLTKLRRSCFNMGVNVDGEKFFTIHFVDDQDVIVEVEDDICYMLQKLGEQYDKWGIAVNIQKTEYIVSENVCRGD